MINILSWNYRGFNSPKKRLLLSEYLVQHQIDIVGFQETKKEYFSERILHKLSSKISFWIFLPSAGNSGGLLLGINESIFHVIDSWVSKYSITIYLKNKNDDFYGYLLLYMALY
jgi:hypothetical protein